MEFCFLREKQTGKNRFLIYVHPLMYTSVYFIMKHCEYNFKKSTRLFPIQSRSIFSERLLTLNIHRRVSDNAVERYPNSFRRGPVEIETAFPTRAQPSHLTP
jgi:hypothetical protein